MVGAGAHETSEQACQYWRGDRKQRSKKQLRKKMESHKTPGIKLEEVEGELNSI